MNDDLRFEVMDYSLAEPVVAVGHIARQDAAKWFKTYKDFKISILAFDHIVPEARKCLKLSVIAGNMAHV